ncbi:ankyrin repeat domain-containing protein [Pseudomonas saponiphila]|jgi:ankyrin repeat protein|uniref:ankyrin repeat domain-containing protein n=1 Tax=Pseudomonas saponiphila TaxID=556534 RepID=UPI000B8A012C|nr:ankyrin repeat domain-containing protein [Pseudomonas saponiphila]
MKILTILLAACMMVGCNGEQSLMDDISANNVANVSAWLHSNKSPDEYLADGWTPLTYASMMGKTEIVKMLVSNGASINKPEGGGNTPLYWAAFNNSYDTVSYLVSAGANTCPVMEDRKSPRDIAQVKGYSSLLKIIPECKSQKIHSADQAR